MRSVAERRPRFTAESMPPRWQEATIMLRQDAVFARLSEKNCSQCDLHQVKRLRGVARAGQVHAGNGVRKECSIHSFRIRHWHINDPHNSDTRPLPVPERAQRGPPRPGLRVQPAHTDKTAHKQRVCRDSIYTPHKQGRHQQ